MALVIFSNWREAVKQINDLDEQSLMDALDFELNNMKRWSIVERLHARLTIVRGKREREEYRRLIKGDKKPPVPAPAPAPTFESLFGE